MEAMVGRRRLELSHVLSPNRTPKASTRIGQEQVTRQGRGDGPSPWSSASRMRSPHRRMVVQRARPCRADVVRGRPGRAMQDRLRMRRRLGVRCRPGDRIEDRPGTSPEGHTVPRRIASLQPPGRAEPWPRHRRVAPPHPSPRGRPRRCGLRAHGRPGPARCARRRTPPSEQQRHQVTVHHTSGRVPRLCSLRSSPGVRCALRWDRPMSQTSNG